MFKSAVVLFGAASFLVGALLMFVAVASFGWLNPAPSRDLLSDLAACKQHIERLSKFIPKGKQ